MTFKKTASSFVFIDASVENYQSLAQGALGANVYILDSTSDGIAQITEILAAAQGAQAIANSIHIVSHGAPGYLYLGNTQLSLDTLDRYASDLRTWFAGTESTAATPSLLLYGCNLAVGDAGVELVDRLHQITGAEIAASNTLTGSLALGGNWNLEVQTGQVAAIAFDAATCDRYCGVLVAVKPGDVTLTGPNVTWSLSNQLGTDSGVPTSGTTNNSPGFGVAYAALPTGQSTGPGIIDGLMLYVNNQNFVAANTGDLTGQTLTTNGSTQYAGLDVAVEYAALQDKPVMRTLASFTNSTNAAITTTVRWVTHLGNGDSSEVKAISDTPESSLTARYPQYDGVFTKDARWIISDDDDRVNAPEFETFGKGGGSNFIRPANTNVLFGPGNPVVKPTSESGTTFVNAGGRPQDNKGVIANYQITIPANSTRSLLFFHGLNSTTDQAKTAATVYDSVTALKNAGDLVGLTSKQLSETLNWQLTTPGVTVTPTAGLQTTEAGGTAQFTVVLTSQPTADVTINLTSSNPNEGKVPASVTFNATNWLTPQTVTVQGVDDKLKDGNIAYTIQTKVTSADAAYAAIDPADVSLVNTDNDTPGVTVTPTSSLQTTEAGGTANFTVVLQSQPTANVTVNLTSSDPTEGKVPASVTFSTANWFTPQTVTVQGVDDTIKDGNVAYTIKTKITSADSTYAAIDPADVSLTNVDNETGSSPELPVFLKGNNRGNQLAGNSGNDKLLGYGGNDKLVGNDGNDWLDGGKNNDALLGGNGNDFLKGGRGRNSLLGGAGQDTFVLEKGGTQIIQDFQDTVDKLGLSGKLKFKDLDIVKSGRNTLIKQDNDVLAVLHGIKPSLISSADFVKV